MAITIDYSPVRAPAEGAYLGGLGQYQQRQQELQLRAAMQAAQLQAQREAQAQNNAIRQQALQQDAMQRGVQNQFQAAKMQNQMGQQAFNNNLAVAGLGLRQQGLKAQADWRSQQVQQADAKQAAALAAGNVKALEDQATRRTQEIGKLELDQDGDQRRRTIVGEINAVRAARGKMSPEQYAEALAKKMEELEAAQLEGNVVQFDPQKVVDESRVPAYEIPGDNTSRLVGHDYVDKKTGQVRHVPLQKREATATVAPITPTFREQYQTPEKLEEYKDKVRKRQEELWKQKQTEAPKGAPPPKMPTPQEAIDSLEEEHKLFYDMHSKELAKKTNQIGMGIASSAAEGAVDPFPDPFQQEIPQEAVVQDQEAEAYFANPNLAAEREALAAEAMAGVQAQIEPQQADPFPDPFQQELPEEMVQEVGVQPQPLPYREIKAQLKQLGITPASEKEMESGLLGTKKVDGKIVPIISPDPDKAAKLFSRLPAGATFLGTDGVLYTKPLPKPAAT